MTEKIKNNKLAVLLLVTGAVYFFSSLPYFLSPRRGSPA